MKIIIKTIWLLAFSTITIPLLEQINTIREAKLVEQALFYFNNRAFDQAIPYLDSLIKLRPTASYNYFIKLFCPLSKQRKYNFGIRSLSIYF